MSLSANFNAAEAVGRPFQGGIGTQEERQIEFGSNREMRDGEKEERWGFPRFKGSYGPSCTIHPEGLPHFQPP